MNDIFKIYDGRTHFWQWDTKQKLLVLDDRISEVRFENKNAQKSKRKLVYINENGENVCDVPDAVLQQPKMLIVYGCIDDDDGTCKTIGMSKIAIMSQAMPESYIPEEETMDYILEKMNVLETSIKNVEKKSEMKKFEKQSDAEEWAELNQTKGIIVLVREKEEWIANVINNDYTVSPICNSDDEKIVVNIDGGDSSNIHS